MTYEQFLESKRHSVNNFGIQPNFIPDGMFDFQKYILEYSVNKGRCANFIDTGLGKTYMNLAAATNYIRHTNKPALIITPLAVGLQTVKEAEKFCIDDISYTKDGAFKTKIVVCNYERLHHLSPNDFDYCALDESSILKNFDGKIKAQVTSFIKKIKYRQLYSATPSPNDFPELGTSSEALGYLGYTDMLTKFFKNNEDTISPMNIGNKWRLKGHAVDDFFRWVSSWSISMRKPSDLGFDDTMFVLPELQINHHSVENSKQLRTNGRINLFQQAMRLTEVRDENKITIKRRCEKAVELTQPYETSVYWCNLNDEGDLLQELDKNAYQIKGSMSIDKKEELLMSFFSGDIKRLITKPKMTAFGLNWQHCYHTTYFPTFSYEQWYQAIRRFWRFGQKNKVVADMVMSDGQQKVLSAILAKTKKADELFTKLNYHLNSNCSFNKNKFDKEIKLPSFL